VISGVNVRKIAISNCYDTVYGKQKCNSFLVVFASRMGREAIEDGYW
jgi:hypothetical protein